jgi:hypothetical protein
VSPSEKNSQPVISLRGERAMRRRPRGKKARVARFVWNPRGEVLGTYTEAQWRKIENSLTRIGIDLGMMVGAPFRRREPWWQCDHANTLYRRPLSDALQEMAWFMGFAIRRDRATPLQKARRLQSQLNTFDSALHSLDDFVQTVPGAVADIVDPDSIINRAKAALTEIINRGRSHIEKFKTMGPASRNNANKAHTLYWLELMRLWRGIAPLTTKHKHKHLSEFLFACSQSLFPGTKHSTITAFVERQFPKMND